MLCQECRKRPATVKVTTIVDGQKREVHLCDECAAVRGELEFGSGASLSLGDMLAALLHHSGLLSHQPEERSDVKCDTCGLSFSQFAKSGKLGCGDCFRQFESQLKPVLRHIHGSARHMGRMPKRAGGLLRVQREIGNLRRELANCVQSERFEQAAQLRDRIRELEEQVQAQAGGPPSEEEQK